MSKRFPNEMKCPDCGLLVMGSKRRGELRSHAQRAIAAGFGDAACASPRPGSRKAEESEAREHRAASAARRRDFWDSRDRPTLITSEGTAQRR